MADPIGQQRDARHAAGIRGVGAVIHSLTLVALWLLVVAVAAPAAFAEPSQPQAAQAPVVRLEGNRESIALTGRVAFLADPSGTLDIDAIRSPAVQARFQVPAEGMRIAADAPPHWFKIRLQRASQENGEWVLTLGTLPSHELLYFGPFDEAAGAAAPALQTGNLGRHPSQSFGLEQHAFSIAPMPAGEYVIYLRAQSPLPQRYAMALQPLDTFTEIRRNGWLLDGVCYGVLFGIAAYTMLMWRTFRDPIYLYFLVSLGVGLGLVALLNGHLPRLLLLGRAELAQRLLLALPALFATFGLLFGHRYLNLARHVPRVARVVQVLAALGLLAAVGAMTGALIWPSILIALAAALGLVLLPIGLRPSRKHGYRINGWYVVASGTCLLSVLVLVATLWGVLPPQVITDRYLQITGVALFGQFALVYGQRLPRVWTQQDALQVQAARLARAAETDPLTGVANRAGLMRRAHALLEPGTERALLMLDLDRFKPINDEFGHEAGDAVLTRITRRFNRLAGPHNLLARLGGDEFVLLLADGRPRAELAAFAQRLVTLAARPIHLEGHSHRVGVSIGIARFPEAGTDLSRLMRRADLALYQAKRDGRGRFAFSEDLPPEDSSMMGLLP